MKLSRLCACGASLFALAAFGLQAQESQPAAPASPPKKACCVEKKAECPPGKDKANCPKSKSDCPPGKAKANCKAAADAAAK